MKRAVLIAAPALVLGALVAACGPDGQAAAPSTAPTTTTPPSSSAVAVPPAPTPAAAGKCPYLDSQFVADANGQHVGSSKVSATSPDLPHPTCFFYRPDGGLQVTVRVYTGDPKVALALVNQATPVSSANPASDPPGWTGGSLSLGRGTGGAVYAIAKGGTAVVVSSNQAQTIKVRRIAVQAVTGLGGS